MESLLSNFDKNFGTSICLEAMSVLVANEGSSFVYLITRLKITAGGPASRTKPLITENHSLLSGYEFRQRSFENHHSVLDELKKAQKKRLAFYLPTYAEIQSD